MIRERQRDVAFRFEVNKKLVLKKNIQEKRIKGFRKNIRILSHARPSPST